MHTSTSWILSLLLVTCAYGEEPGLQSDKRLTPTEAGELIRAHLRETDPDRKADAPLLVEEFAAPRLFERLGAQVFGTAQDGCYLIRGSSVQPLGLGQTGVELRSLLLEDLDGDGQDELVYTYSWGNAIRSAHVAGWALVDGKGRNLVIPLTSKNDLFARKIEDGQIQIEVGTSAGAVNKWTTVATLGHLKARGGAKGPRVELVVADPLPDSIRDTIWDSTGPNERHGRQVRDGWAIIRPFKRIGEPLPKDKEYFYRAMAFSPDGRFLAAGFYKEMDLWAVAENRRAAVFRGEEDYWEQLVFSRDGERLAARHECHVYVWDVKSRKTILDKSSWISPNSYITTQQIALSPDGRWLAAGNDRMRVYEVDGGKELLSLDGSDSANPSVALSADGRFLLSAKSLSFEEAKGRQKSIVTLWDVASGKLLNQIEIGKRELETVAFSPDGLTFAYCDGTADLTLRPARQDGEKLVFKGHRKPITCMAFSPDGLWLATGSEDNTVRVWEVATGQEVTVLTGFEGAPRRVRFSPRSRAVASTGYYGPLRMWSAATGGVLIRPDGENRCSFARPAFTWDGRTVAVGRSDGTVDLYNLDEMLEAARSKPAEGSARTMAQLWDALASPKGAEGWQAIWELVSRQGAVDFVQAELAKEPDPWVEATPLVEDLNAEDFEKRDTATRRLRGIGACAAPLLLKTLEIEREHTPEFRDRAQRILGGVACPPMEMAGHVLRTRRAVFVLEALDTPEARAALAQFAKRPGEFRAACAEVCLKRLTGNR